ncbi:hypothetical protein RSAG8_05331, partial [Rhizoctonia solani AG-8 WAC10335]
MVDMVRGRCLVVVKGLCDRERRNEDERVVESTVFSGQSTDRHVMLSIRVSHWSRDPRVSKYGCPTGSPTTT